MVILIKRSNKGEKMSAEIMDIRDLAEYLSMSPSTLYRWVEAGEIPCTRIGRNIRFRKVDIDLWLTERTSSWQMRIFDPGVE